jgi:hypothetical protein
LAAIHGLETLNKCISAELSSHGMREQMFKR